MCGTKYIQFTSQILPCINIIDTNDLAACQQGAQNIGIIHSLNTNRTVDFRGKNLTGAIAKDTTAGCIRATADFDRLRGNHRAAGIDELP